MPVGVAVFGAGAPGSLTYAAAETDKPVFSFGKVQAQTLHDTGAVAFVVQVDSLSQGHRGLTYTVTPAISGGLFGASTMVLTKVASAAACTTSTTGPAPTPTTSVPWTGTYNEATAPVAEYWCVVAKWTRVTGTHTDTVTASGTSADGTPVPVTATDTWNATVDNNIDPTVEPTQKLTFDFRTFRGSP